MHEPRNTTDTVAGSPGVLRERLQDLYLERALAGVEGLGDNATYMVDLDEEIAATRASYVGAAVTQIATLRAELSGALRG